jgi:hypothetical protein
MTSLLSRRNAELSAEQVREKQIRHVYYGMISRCSKPSNAKYRHYGARGIRVCDRWQGSGGYAHFIADMGDRPEGASLDRIDNDGGYSPENCRWATRAQQERNKRTTRTLTFSGQTRSIAEWAEVCSIPYKILLQRIARGWSAERTLTHPR